MRAAVSWRRRLRSPPPAAAERQPTVRWPAEFVQQPLRLGRRRRIQHIRQHRSASVIRLHRQPAFARWRHAPASANARRLHATGRSSAAVAPPRSPRRAPGCPSAAPPAMPRARSRRLLTLRVQPRVEVRIDAVQVLQQVAVQQRQRRRLARWSRCMTSSMSIHTAPGRKVR